MLDSTARTTEPFTGQEYLESIRDGREVYVYGERVDDVTTHPAFRNTARSIARLYDALHDPERRAVITTPTDTGSEGVTHKFFRVPRTVEDCVGDLEAIAEWARIGYGWLGRSPDYKAAFLATLGANADFYDPYQDNARRWYREAQERVLYWNHAIIHPPVDRSRPPEEVSDVFMHVEEERDNGIVVSGAKVVATGSALTHYNFIAHYGPIPIQKKEYAIVCAVSIDTPGEADLSTIMRSPGHRRPTWYRLQPAQRERLDLHLRQGARAVGERVRLRRHRQGEQLLPPHRIHPALLLPRLHPPGGQARLHRRSAAQGG